MAFEVQQSTPDGPDSSGRAVSVYQRAMLGAFAFLKRTERLDDLLAKSVPLPEGKGYLVPVCDLHGGDDAMIARFARWRSENAFAFPSRFPVTIPGTASWLRSRLLDVPDRMLFLVVDRWGNPIGHLGLANGDNDEAAIEIDNVVRGEPEAGRGLMGVAVTAMLDWAEEMFRPRSVFLRVLSDNEHAIGFYRKLGFRDDDLLPLRRHDEGEAVLFHDPAEGDAAPPDAHFLRMIYAPNRVVDGSELILTAGPSISMRETSYALDATRNGWNGQWSVYIRRFESTFAEYVGTKHALSTSSGTGALHLSLAAMGIGPGDEVIVPDMTWVATANAVAYCGATPVFADIEADGWCLDPRSFEAAITERTRAVVPVHLYGHPANMDPIMEIARRNGLLVLEDAAPAIGAEVRGRQVGTFGDAAAFSFQGAKLLVTGEGGMIVSNDDALFEKIQLLWDQGRDPNRMFWINQIGWKYKMSNVQAAIGLGQIERSDEQIEAKRLINSWYAEDLAGVPHITLSGEAPWARSIHWMTSLVLEEGADISRDAFRAELKRRNVDTRPVFPAISQYPMWQRRQAPNPTAFRIGEWGVNLPSGVRLKREQVAYVCRCIRDVLSSARSVAA